MRRGVVPCQLALALRVFTRPVSVVLSRLGTMELSRLVYRSPPGGLSPWVLSSTPCAGSARQDAHPSVVLAPPVSCPGGLCSTVRFALRRITGLTGPLE